MTSSAQICRLLIDDVNQALAPQGHPDLDVDDAAIEWLLAQSGEEPNMGARPLRRAIQRNIEDELSEYLIRHKDEGIESVDFTLQEGRIVLVPTRTDTDVVTNTVN